jgi:hypothetical protein
MSTVSEHMFLLVAIEFQSRNRNVGSPVVTTVVWPDYLKEAALAYYNTNTVDVLEGTVQAGREITVGFDFFQNALKAQLAADYSQSFHSEGSSERKQALRAWQNFLDTFSRDFGQKVTRVTQGF